jgi:DNA-binding MarR family transcriptional regulator
MECSRVASGRPYRKWTVEMPRRETLPSMQRHRSASVSRALVIFADDCRSRLMKEFGDGRFPSVDFPNAALWRNLDLHEGADLSTLARRAGVSRQAMQKLARKLERTGLVRLTPDRRDGRRLEVRFTPKGRAMIQESLKVYDRFDAEFAATLGTRRLKQLRDTLQKLAGASTKR